MDVNFSETSLNLNQKWGCLIGNQSVPNDFLSMSAVYFYFKNTSDHRGQHEMRLCRVIELPCMESMCFFKASLSYFTLCGWEHVSSGRTLAVHQCSPLPTQPFFPSWDTNIDCVWWKFYEELSWPACTVSHIRFRSGWCGGFRRGRQKPG